MKSFTGIFVVCAFSVALLQCALAKEYKVGGDDIGWTTPPKGAATTYSDWASHQKFGVGDILSDVFEFDTDKSDVKRVSKDSYDKRSSDNGKGSTISVGPARVTLDSPGDYYYICTFSGRCSAGQKLFISVPPKKPGKRRRICRRFPFC